MKKKSLNFAGRAIKSIVLLLLFCSNVYATTAGDFAAILHPISQVAITRGASNIPSAPGTLTFQAMDQTFSIILEPNLLITKTPPAEWPETTSPPPQNTDASFFKGRLADDPNSWVRLTLRNGLIEGMIWRQDEVYFIEPKQHFDAGAAAAERVIYRLSDAPPLWTPRSCGVDAAMPPSTNALGDIKALVTELKTGAVTGGSLALGLIADYEYYKAFGSDTVVKLQSTINQIDGIMQQALGIGVNIGTTQVFSTNNQPLTATSATALLMQLSDLRSNRSSPFYSSGLAHLMTGKDLDGDTVGIAFVGGVCQGTQATSLTQNYNEWTSAQVLLTAHEIGHSLGASHDGQEACAATGMGYIMWPWLQSSTKTEFSSCSRDAIKARLARVGCLAVNDPPVAAAGDDHFVYGSETITLDGAFSYDPDGTITRFSWKQLIGDDIGFVSSSAASVTLKIPAISDSRTERKFTFELMVQDNNGSTSSDTVDVIQTTADNKSPVADAGPDQTFFGEQTFHLNGSASHDPEAQPLTYRWTQVSGAPVTINYFDTASPLIQIFASDSDRVFVFKLTVTDVAGATGEDTVTITQKGATVGNKAPTADAGNDITVKVGQSFTLDASASSDPDGAITNYAWSNGHAGKTVTTSIAKAGTYTIQLTVTDNAGATATDDVVVTVLQAGYKKNFDALFLRGTFNNWTTSPMALIGDNLWKITAEFGSGTNLRFKFDVYGDWRKNYGDNDGNGIGDSFGKDIPIKKSGSYTITFNDRSLAYTSSLSTPTGTNTPPIASAGDDITVTAGATVQFDASDSRDTDGTISAYQWTSTAFSGPLSGVKTSYLFKTEGDFDVILTVTDNSGATATDTRRIHVVTAPSGGGENWKPTVVMIFGETKPGQDMYIRGGLDWDYARDKLGRDCSSDKWLCTIPIVHKLPADKPERLKDTLLDWYGAQTGQGDIEGSPLIWTTDDWPSSWGAQKTVERDGYGETPWNQWGPHYWMLYVDMDCSKTANGWFELKSFISNGPGWEGDITQPNAPYKSSNHLAQCGKLNVFKRGQNEPVAIKSIPSGNPAPATERSVTILYK